MFTNYGSWSIDISTILMTNTCKYSLFAYAVEDGHAKGKSFTPEQKHNSIEEIPSFFKFMSYCKFLPTAVIGTAIEFKLFDDYMNSKGQFKNIPSSWKKMALDMGEGIIYGLLFILHVVFFPLAEMQSPEFL